ncbi:hypothetical protein WA026_011055 [Henosepilachna vigintioctopunctata]|uniref:oleoyl-[acyl-carrier-protein] hydrolase n=1 Tax=Henosepilachna vigintioctopunctata TaxID=420089 RepID=A0AAW1U4N7_9CUCU
MMFSSVRCLAKGGRFLELGQFDILKDNRLSLMLLEKECSFHGIFLDSLFKKTGEAKSIIYSLLEEGIEKRLIEPITRRIFQPNEIVDVFRYMSTGEHTGKNLIKIREEEMKWTNELPKPVYLKGKARFWCDPMKSYIIVGGIGGFGLELADWLVLKGARKLILSSRIGVRTGYQSNIINIWKSQGVVVEISTADVTTREGCEKLISESKSLGTVDGLFNLAAVLKDSLLENQNVESFKIAFGPKVKATKYLDEITRCRCPKLRHFVVFSSIICGRGNPGQTNYGMANSAMERICENRKAAGYSALVIRWGAVADVGLAAEMPKNIESDFFGTCPQRISSCLQVMDTFLTQKQATIVSSTVLANEKKRTASKNIAEATANILGIRISTASPYTTLSELGMDSLTAVEVKQALETDFDIFLSPHEIRSLTFSKLNAIQDERCGIREKKLISSKQEMTGWNIFINEFNDDYMISSPLVQLPSLCGDDSDAPLLYMFPGIEGYVKPMSCLASKLKAKIIGLQCCCQVPPYTIAQHAESCLVKMKKYLKPNTIVNILSFSWGTVIALEVISRLERLGYKVNSIIIDGAPEIIPNILTKQLKNTSDTEVHIFSLSVLMMKFLPNETVIENRKALEKCTSMSERLDVFLKAMEQVEQLSQENKRILAIAIYTRIKDSLFYKANYGAIMATTRLFKPSISLDQLTLPEDYNLSRICSNLEDIRYFEGNHQSIMENEEVADAINVAIRGKTSQFIVTVKNSK